MLQTVHGNSDSSMMNLSISGPVQTNHIYKQTTDKYKVA